MNINNELKNAFAGCSRITVYGDAMLPKYEPGDVLFLKQLPGAAIHYGDDYIVILKGGDLKLLRTIRKSDIPGKVILRAYGNCDDIHVCESDISCVFDVEGQMRRFKIKATD
jgi:hypothetical protein